MRWSKFILVFQAVVTLVLGIIFLLSFLTLDNLNFDNFKKSFTVDEDELRKDPIAPVNNLMQRYLVAAYILLIVSVIEILLVMGLMSS